MYSKYTSHIKALFFRSEAFKAFINAWMNYVTVVEDQSKPLLQPAVSSSDIYAFPLISPPPFSPPPLFSLDCCSDMPDTSDDDSSLNGVFDEIMPLPEIVIIDVNSDLNEIVLDDSLLKQ